jgi:cytoskeletal protein RodZ
MEPNRHEPRARLRDAGVTRLKRATRLVVLGATALAGAFAGLAAHSVPGHSKSSSAVRTTTRTVRTTTSQATTTSHGTTTPPVATTTTTAPPVTTSVAPVATTGGT